MGKFEVQIDEDLMDIMESFIDLTEKDMKDLSASISVRDKESTMKLAHTLKGDSGGYGFSEMSELSRQLEVAVKEDDSQKLETHWNDLQEYWEEVKEAYNNAKDKL